MRPVALSVLMLALPVMAAGPATYPTSKKVDQVDTYHGTKVADPYRWLEDDNASETKEWVERQNTLTQDYLGKIPQRAPIHARLTKLWNYERFSVPGKEGGRYFFSRNDGLQAQSVLFVADAIDKDARLLLDPNTLAKDGTMAMAGMAVSEDGSLMAYGTAEAGSDWNKWKVRDVATGQDRADLLDWVKFSGASWTKDNKGFFYTRYDAPAEGKVLTGVNKYPKVHYHRVGTPQSEDVLIYDRPDQAEWGFGASVTDDGHYVVLNVSQGTDRKNRFFYRDIKTDGLVHKATAADQAIREAELAVQKNVPKDKAGATPELAKSEAEAARAERVKANGLRAHGFVELLNDFDASYDFVDNDGPVFWFLTDSNAPRGRLIAIDTRNPARDQWKEIIPQSDATLTGVSVVGGHLVAQYLNNAYSQVKVFDLTGKLVRNVDLPGIGTAAGFGGKRSDPETFYSFTSYTMPPSIFRYDVKTGQSTLWKAPKVDFDSSAYETKQVFYTSKDGTRVPMFITHKKGLNLDGNNPTLLYGYGGFNISITPAFSPATAVWLEMGGVYAVANIRGGGEFGEEWHQSGTKLRKQNVFDDFIAAGEYLVQTKYTQPKKLAIQGGSNGGLLVGACMTQRPDLFGAALPAVGVMDMLRFHQFTIGWAWKSDYGSSEDPDQFKALYAYSPYHQMLRAKPGTKFPATMVTTGDHDDRVVPGHSFKFAAAMQAVGAPAGNFDEQNPLLIRIDVRAGHGAGKPTAKRIDEAADVWAFLVRALGMNPSLASAGEPALAKPANARMVLAIDGMKCAICQGKVNALLARVPGVQTVRVDLEAKQAVLGLDEAAPANEQAVLAAFAGSEFSAKVKR
jgi:prolyl oligopeptidase